MKLIKGYFNSYHLELESLLRKERLRRRFRKISINRIFLSEGEFKHTNDKETRHTGIAIVYRSLHRNLFPYPVRIDITVLLAVDR